MRPRIVLAEDGALLRAGLSDSLKRLGFDVVAAVADAPSLTTAADDAQPALVLTDVRMPPGNTDDGIRAVVALRNRRPQLPVVVLTQHADERYAADLLDSGAGTHLAFLLKDRVVDIADFADVLRRVIDGAVVIDPDLVRRLVRRADPLARLTPRENEVLSLVAAGHSNAGIAAILVITDAAVVKHIGSIFAKLNLAPATTSTAASLQPLPTTTSQRHRRSRTVQPGCHRVLTVARYFHRVESG